MAIYMPGIDRFAIFTPCPLAQFYSNAVGANGVDDPNCTCGQLDLFTRSILVLTTQANQCLSLLMRERERESRNLPHSQISLYVGPPKHHSYRDKSLHKEALDVYLRKIKKSTTTCLSWTLTFIFFTIPYSF